MSDNLLSRRKFLAGLAATGAAALASCAPKVVEVEKIVEKEVTVVVTEEKVVKEAVEVEKEVTRVVEKVVEQPPADKAPVEIRIHRMPASWTESVHEEFAARYPHITVKEEAAPGSEYWTKLRTMYAGGRLGDTFWTWAENGDFKQFSDSGMVASIQPYVDAEGFDTNAYFASALNEFYVEGELHLIPEYAHPGPTGVYVNKTMCDEVGLTYVPETNAREADIYDDWTHEEFLEVTKKLTKMDDSGNVIQYGYSRFSNFHQQVSIMRRFGGDVLADDGKTVTVDSEASIAGIQFVADMFHEYKVRPTPDSMEDNPRNLFIGGEKVAAFCHGAASATQLKRLLEGRFDYVGVTLPRHSTLGTRGLILSTGGNCVTTLSKQPEAAWEYCKFMGSHYVGTQRTLIGGAGPGGRPDCWYDERIQAYHRVIPKFAELIPEAKPHNLPWNGRAAELQDAVNQNIQKVWLGKLTAEEGCQEAADAARKVLDKKAI